MTSHDTTHRTAPHLTEPQCVQRTARLTERLRQSASAHQHNAITPQPASEREIIESLNATIHGLMNEQPLMLPEPISAPEQVSALDQPHDPASTPTGLVPRAEDGDLREWLTRPADEQPETRSRSSVVTLCVGTMLLSVLAGYGSAQLLNRSLDTTEQNEPNWKTVASNAAMSLTWPSSTGASHPETSGTPPKRQVERVRVVPVVQTKAGLVRVSGDDITSGALDDTSETKPPVSVSPQTAQEDGGNHSLAGLEANKVLKPTQTVETGTIAGTNEERQTRAPKLELAAAATGIVQIPDEESDRLFRRAEQLISDGDIAAARLMLRHLAEAGNGPAALQLARAYDPEWLTEKGFGGVPANPDLALRWYTMARDRGQDGAAQRVEAMEAAQ